MKWVVTGGGYQSYNGLIAFHDGMTREERLAVVWPEDSTSEEIALCLERLAREIRRVST